MPRSSESLPDRPSSLPVLLAVLWLALLGFIWAHQFRGKVPDRDFLPRNTIRLALAYYALAATLMLRLRPVGWSAATSSGRLARACWTLACLAYLLHVACAFHYAHHWSHAEAYEHVRQAGGVGEGIFVSYLFTLLWTGDVIWWWTAPAGYARRFPWIDRLLHGFMLFVIFNATVVFEFGPVRWAGTALFVWLAVVWLASRGRQRPRSFDRGV